MNVTTELKQYVREKIDKILKEKRDKLEQTACKKYVQDLKKLNTLKMEMEKQQTKLQHLNDDLNKARRMVEEKLRTKGLELKHEYLEGNNFTKYIYSLRLRIEPFKNPFNELMVKLQYENSLNLQDIDKIISDYMKE